MSKNQAISKLGKYASMLLTEEGAHHDGASAKHGSRSPTWHPMRIAMPAMVLVVFGNIGLAAAADSSVPGDLLYPVDRAYESIAEAIGVSSDNATERLSEASVLLAHGEFSGAVEAIAASAGETSSAIDDRIRLVGTQLAEADATTVDREDLHRSVATLASTVQVIAASDEDPSVWMNTLDANSQAVIDVIEGLPYEPEEPGDSFVAPGQDDDFAPPGQDSGSLPPGLDDQFVPPGRDDNRTPPSQDRNQTAPGQEDRGNSR